MLIEKEVKMNKDIMKKSKGFTLIEVLVATAILVMAGTAAVAVEYRFMGSASTQKHRLQATALAQEGINMVRQKYTSNLLPDNPRLSGADLWEIAYGGPTGNVMINGDNDYVLVGQDNQLHVKSGSNNGEIPLDNNFIFTRLITFTNLSSDVGQVNVTVTWNEGARPEYVELKTILEDVR